MGNWALHDVNGRFNEVIELARREGPQRVTKNGQAIAMIVATEQFRRLTRRRQRGNLVDFLRHSPLSELDPRWMDRDRENGREVKM